MGKYRNWNRYNEERREIKLIKATATIVIFSIIMPAITREWFFLTINSIAIAGMAIAWWKEYDAEASRQILKWGTIIIAIMIAMEITEIVIEFMDNPPTIKK
jgi:hypothetical protein